MPSVCGGSARDTLFRFERRVGETRVWGERKQQHLFVEYVGGHERGHQAEVHGVVVHKWHRAEALRSSGKARKGEERQGKAREGKASTRQGQARKGKESEGKYMQGQARTDKEMKGNERKGK